MARRIGNPQRLDLRQIRRAAGSVHDRLNQKHARTSRIETLELLRIVSQLADELEAARDRLDTHERMAWVGETYDGICAGLRELGIDVTQSAPFTAWDWRYGTLTGSEPTIASAMLAGLRAAGAGTVARIDPLQAEVLGRLQIDQSATE